MPRSTAASPPFAALGALAALLLVLLLAPAPARAGDPLEFTTKVQASDVTHVSLRRGAIGDRCVSWRKLDAHMVAKLGPTAGKLTLVEPPGPVGPMVVHTLERPKLTFTLKTTGTDHQAFPCGCGPNSELGPCPAAEEPDLSLNASCKQTSPSGLLGLVQKKQFRLWPLVSGPIGAMIERCALPLPRLMPSGLGFTDQVQLGKSAIWDLRKVKVGRSKTFKATVDHDGNDTCLPPGEGLADQCAVQTFSITVKRTK